MAWDDTPPTTIELKKSTVAWDAAPPKPEELAQGSYWSDVAKNTGKEVEGMINGIPAMGKMALQIGSLPMDTLRYAGERTTGKTHGETAMAEDISTIQGIAKASPQIAVGMAKDIGNSFVHPVESFRKAPIGTATNILSIAVPAVRGAKALKEAEAISTIGKVIENPSMAPALSKRIMAKGISAIFGPKTEAILRRWDNPEAIAQAGTHTDVAEKLSGAVKKLEKTISVQDKKAWSALRDLPDELKRLPPGMTENDIKAAAVQLRNSALEEKAASEYLPAKIRELGGISGNRPGVGGVRPESEEFMRNVPIHLRGRFPADQMAQMLVDEGLLPPGSGASDLYEKLSNLKRAQEVPPLKEMIRQVRQGVIQNSFDPTAVSAQAAPIERKAIDGLIDQAKEKIGNPVGRPDHQALRTLSETQSDIKAFGKYISEKETKSIIQKIRNSIDYGDETAQTANESLKSVVAQLDEILKSKNPTYRKLMKPVAEKMDLHSDIKRLFNLRKETNEGLQATETTASKLANLSRANKDISKETLERLRKATKTDVARMANDASLAREFQGGRPNGSRRVAFGTVIGTGVGKLIGSPTIGALTGSTLGLLSDSYGGQMAGKIVDALANPKFARYSGIIEKAAKSGARNLAAVQTVLLESDPAYRAEIEGNSRADVLRSGK